jgi:hypothetical protein
MVQTKARGKIEMELPKTAKFAHRIVQSLLECAGDTILEFESTNKGYSAGSLLNRAANGQRLKKGTKSVYTAGAAPDNSVAVQDPLRLMLQGFVQSHDVQNVIRWRRRRGELEN